SCCWTTWLKRATGETPNPGRHPGPAADEHSMTQAYQAHNDTAKGSTPRRLLPQHLAELERSGLTPEYIERCGFRSVTDRSAARISLGWDVPPGMVPALAIPF